MAPLDARSEDTWYSLQPHCVSPLKAVLVASGRNAAVFNPEYFGKISIARCRDAGILRGPASRGTSARMWRRGKRALVPGGQTDINRIVQQAVGSERSIGLIIKIA